MNFLSSHLQTLPGNWLVNLFLNVAPWAPPPKTLVQTFWRIRAQESDVLTHIQHNVDANYALRLSSQDSPGHFRTDGADFFTAQQIQSNILNMQQLFDQKES